MGIAASIAIMYYWLLPDSNWRGVKVQRGEIREVNLPDGSLVRLIGPSQIGFPKTFDEKVRKVKIEGVVYFEIKRDSSRNFLIQSEKGGVETKEAKVIINTRERKNITVYCLKHSVRMIARGKKKVLETTLQANEMSSFTKGDGNLRKELLDSLTLPNFQN